MNGQQVLGELARLPRTAVEFANVVLTTDDAVIGATPKDVVWTHRKTTLYRYRSRERRHPIPVLFVFALINRPDIFDLRPGHSFVEYMLAQGYDVFLVDWGEPGDEDAEMGIADYICDELHWAVRETRRAAGSSQIGLLGWCIGAALVAMYAALYPEDLASLTLLTMPVDTEGSLYHKWVNASTYDVDALTAAQPTIAGGGIDWANRTMRPVVNYWMPYRRLWEQVAAGTVNRDAYQSMAKWVADNPPFPGKAYQEWIKWIYQENRLVRGRVRLRGQRVDFGKITCPILVVTASQDHIAPRAGTLPILDMFGSSDITHFDRAGGHIGLMAGSKARKEIWPDIANWLEPRSQLHG